MRQFLRSKLQSDSNILNNVKKVLDISIPSKNIVFNYYATDEGDLFELK